MPAEPEKSGARSVLTQRQGNVLLVTLNRPRVRNAMNLDMVQRLREVFAACRQNADIRVVILTGAGDKAFCAGADLTERLAQTEQEIRRYNRTMAKFSFIENLDKPVIAAINGVAYGGGTEIALAADLRVASRRAMLGLIETQLAIIPGAGGTQRLPRMIGMGMAKELIYTGRRITAREALAMGLVNRVCAPENLLAESLQLASMISRNSAVAVAAAKFAMNQGAAVDLQHGFALETEAYCKTLATRDRREALCAFKEKRKPLYHDV